MFVLDRIYKNYKTKVAENQAMKWLVELDDPSAQHGDKLDFKDWLSKPDNKAAFEKVSELWYQVPLMTELAELVPVPTKETRQSSVKRNPTSRIPSGYFQPAFAFSVVLFLGLFVSYGFPVKSGPDYSTGIAEIRELTLEDGSGISLGAKSKLNVIFTEAERHIELLEGEAFFSVTPNPDRPFIVTSNNTTVTVKGTKFNVHSGPEKTSVTVMEGLVEVQNITLDSQPEEVEETIKSQFLEAGERVSVAIDGTIEGVKEINPTDTDAWRLGYLYYDNASLKEVIADANRYSVDEIEIIDQSIEDLRVTASFRSYQIPKMLQALEQGFPVKVEVLKSGKVILSSIQKE